MATRYFARERFFTGLSPSLIQSTVVFASEDLTADECQTLAQSVQKSLDDLEDMKLADSWFFELGPSAEEDPVTFINLKSDWERTKCEIDGYRKASGNSWQSDVHWLYSIAREHADIIRRIRSAELPIVYLQCDSGRGYETFECVDCLTWDELETLESLAVLEMYELGLCMRVVSDWHAEREPVVYLQAKMGWKQFQEATKEDRVKEMLLAASGVTYECIDEIKALRSKPIIYGAVLEPDSNEEHPEQQPPPKPDSALLVRADESLRAGYRDPDNYSRNVWLYELRKAGKTNSEIRNELAARAEEFAPIESDNALRTAIESIASYHRWPTLKGRTGRPKAKDEGVGAR